MNKILVAADGSAYTIKALEYLIEHRAQFGLSPVLELIHVHHPLPSRAASALGRDTVRKYHEDETRKALVPARRMLDKAGFTYTVVQRVGDAAEEISAYAQKGKFTLLVMGSHGHGALATMALGSTVSKVLARCKTPMLILR